MSKKRKEEYYNSTEIPLQYIWNIIDTGNFVWMVKGGNYSEVDETEESVLAFSQACKDVLNRHGVDDDYMDLLNMQQREVLLRCKAMKKIGFDGMPDRTLWWKADRLRVQINKKIAGSGDGDRYGNFIAVTTKIQGKSGNPMEVTYDMYHGMQNYYGKLVTAEKLAFEASKAKAKR